MADTFSLISSTTLSNTSSAVTFSSIPQNFTDLFLSASVRSDSVGTTIHDFTYRLNGLSTSVYSKTQLTGSGSGGGTGYRQTTTKFAVENSMPGASATANTFGAIEVYIPSYTATQNKTIGHFGVSENNATLAVVNAMAGY